MHAHTINRRDPQRLPCAASIFSNLYDPCIYCDAQAAALLDEPADYVLLHEGCKLVLVAGGTLARDPFDELLNTSNFLHV